MLSTAFKAEKSYQSTDKMVSTWSSGSTFPSANFQSMFDNSNPDEEFTFVDFLPECRTPSGIFSEAKYETFRSTVDRANNWLRSHPQWEVKTCESVEFKDSGDVIKTEKMIFVEREGFYISFIRGLRLWISKRKSNKDRCQQIGYLNMVPDSLKEGGIFSSPKYESLDDIINRYNTMIRTQPIPGRILTIETQELKMKNKNEVDPEKSNWYEREDYMKNYLFILRIFFEITEPTENVPSEEIGIMDFIPNLIDSGGIITMPKYDLFSNTVLKASNWCSGQTGIRICNVQSVEVKLKRGHEVDTQKTYFVESGNVMTFYVRIVRATYTKCPLASKLDADPISHLTCKTFVPVQTSNSIFIPDFESLTETKARVSAWIKATGAQVISAETSAMRMYSGGERKLGAEASFTYNRAERTEYWIFVIRLYINGIYKEPPIEMLPPLPIIEDRGCCTML